MAKYKFTYYFYLCEKAKIVKLFHLKKTYIIINGYFKAKNLPYIIKGKNANIFEIANIKAFFAKFE